MKVLTFIFLTTLSICTHARESCELFGVIATNYAQTAYNLASEEPDLIDKNGLFNTWSSILAHMLEDSEKNGRHEREFFASSKIAGATMVENQKDIESKVSSSGYAPLFSRMVIRTCQAGRASETSSN